MEVTEKSPLETVEPMCSRFGKCGGCSYQTLPYEKQLELKRNQVLEIIDNVYKTLDSSLGIKKDYIYDGQVLKSKATETRWNFHSVMNTKEDHLH